MHVAFFIAPQGFFILGMAHMIYFISQEGRYVKIGRTLDFINVTARITEMQIGNPHTLTLLGTCAGGKAKERKIQERFSDNRVRGEWFLINNKFKNYLASDEIEKQQAQPVNQRRMSRQLKWQRKKKGEGNCQQCGNPSEGFALCPKCKDIRNTSD